MQFTVLHIYLHTLISGPIVSPHRPHPQEARDFEKATGSPNIFQTLRCIILLPPARRRTSSHYTAGHRNASPHLSSIKTPPVTTKTSRDTVFMPILDKTALHIYIPSPDPPPLCPFPPDTYRNRRSSTNLFRI